MAMQKKSSPIQHQPDWLLIGLALLLVVQMTFLSVPGPARAGGLTIIIVTTVADELNNDSDCSLREAIKAANHDIAVSGCPAGSGHDVIHLGPGHYALSLPGIGEDLGMTGDLDIFSDLTITGEGADQTIIDGNGLDRVFHIVGENSVKILGVKITNGYASSSGVYGGGGILNENGDLEVLVSVISDSHAIKTGGGVDNSSSARFTNVTLTGNTSTEGGGIFNDGTLVLTNVVLHGNSATSTGGGIDNQYEALLTSVTISGNTAQQEGGGLFTDGAMEMTILNSTFMENSTGVANAGTSVRFKNTIVANSTAGDNCTGSVGSFTSLGHNLDSGNTCRFASPGDQSSVNPMLGPLQDNQGPTYTHAVLPGSPAIDQGDNIDCPDVDQRGAFRPADGDEDGLKICDVGAYEYRGNFPAPVFLPLISRSR